jgi:hypothetical protein
MEPGDYLEAVAKRKLSNCKESNPAIPTPTLVTILTEVSRLSVGISTNVICC